MARMRTINEAYEELKRNDPDTAIKANSIRILCKNNKISYVLIGRKYLVDMDSLIDFLGYK